MESFGTLRLVAECSNFTISQFATLWRCIITEYSGRLLTDPDDKFPAISGLARKFYDYTGQTYCAGLRQGSLLDDLLWAHCAIDFGNIAERMYPANKRAPSWSWATLDGYVRWQCEPVRKSAWSFSSEEPANHATVVNCRLNSLDNDSFGALKVGELILRAPITRINYVEAWSYFSSPSPSVWAVDNCRTDLC